MIEIVKDVFGYALRPSGRYLFVIGAGLFLMMDLAVLAPLFGAIAIFLLACYLAATYVELIQRSATRDLDAPAFADISNLMSDVISPAFQLALVYLLSFGAYFWALYTESLPSIGVYALYVVGAFYFPMAMLAVVILGQLSAASPHIVLPSLWRGGKVYLCCVGMLVGLKLIEIQLSAVLDGIFILGSVISSFVAMYALMTSARLLGVIYRERSEELGWL